MSVPAADFASMIRLEALIHKRNTNRATELAAIATALGTDTTVHDKTIEAAPAGLSFGDATQTRFTNDILRRVNIGKAGNLSAAAMATAITALAGALP